MINEGSPPGRWTRNHLMGQVGASVQAGVIYGDVAITPHTVVPAQLPAPAPWFTNRRRELAGLQDLLDPVAIPAPPRVVVLRGVGGAGKTALALQWAHMVRDQFEGGQFFIDLRGFSGDRLGPVEPGAAVAGFLRAVGIHPDFIPPEVAEQEALWRSATAGRRVLIVADNAASVTQVRPLLPGSAPAVVLVTTRLPPAELALDGAHELHIGRLDDPSSIKLLQQIAGPDRLLHAENPALRSLVARSGRLPLTLRTLGAHLRKHPDRPVQALVDVLNHHQPTTRTEDEMDNATTAALDAAYQELADGEQVIYEMVGDLPGADVAIRTVAELMGIAYEEALLRLSRLTEAGLMEPTSDQRFRLHDRIRPHAEAKAAAALTNEELLDQRRRAIVWYRDRAADVARAIIKRWYLGDCFHRPIGKDFTREGALDWLESEKDNLLATQHMAFDLGMAEAVCDITEAAWPLFVYGKHVTLWRRFCENGLKAAKAAGDGVRMARMYEGFGSVHQYRHEWIKAEEYFRTALALEEENNHLIGAASAFEGIGTCQLHLGNHEEAIAFFMRSLGYHQALERPRGARLQVRHIAETHLAADRPDEALAAIAKARSFDFAPDEDYLKSRELLVEGNSYLKIGDLDRAEEILTRHLELTRRIRANNEEANSHIALADLAHMRSDRDREVENLTAACLIYKRLGSPKASELKQRLMNL